MAEKLAPIDFLSRSSKATASSIARRMESWVETLLAGAGKEYLAAVTTGALLIIDNPGHAQAPAVLTHRHNQ